MIRSDRSEFSGICQVYYIGFVIALLIHVRSLYRFHFVHPERTYDGGIQLETNRPENCEHTDRVEVFVEECGPAS